MCFLPQVTSEGGLDAAFEAPNVYAAMDALAARARLWAERRQRLLGERGEGGALAPEEAGRIAAAAVKQASALRRGGGCDNPIMRAGGAGGCASAWACEGHVCL